MKKGSKKLKHEDQIASTKEVVSITLRKWKEEDTAAKVLRGFLSEEALSGKSHLDEILEELKRLALNSFDEDVRRKAIKDLIELAKGREESESKLSSTMPVNIVINGVGSNKQMTDVTPYNKSININDKSP